MSFKLTPVALSIVLSFGLIGCNSDSSDSVFKPTPETSIPSTPIIDMSVLKYIDPMIGTAASGHTFPSLVLLFLVAWCNYHLILLKERIKIQKRDKTHGTQLLDIGMPVTMLKVMYLRLI